MQIIDAYHILDRCIVLVLNEEIDYSYNKVLIDNIAYPYNFVHETVNCLTIKPNGLNAKALINKPIQFVR